VCERERERSERERAREIFAQHDRVAQIQVCVYTCEYGGGLGEMNRKRRTERDR